MTETREGFRDGDRHGWLDQWCELVARMVVARDASRVLASLPKGPVERSAVVVLPVWQWRYAKASVGKKDRSGDGGQLQLPMRTAWQPGTVLVLPESSHVVAEWTAVGLGYDEAGSLTVACHGDGCGVGLVEQLAGETYAPAMSGVLVRQELSRLAADGTIARWEAVELLTPIVEREVFKAYRAQCNNVGWSDAEPRELLDRTSLDRVVDRMVLGEEGLDDTSPVMRMIDRSLDPLLYARVEPSHWLQIHIHREASRLVQLACGDCGNTGPKIRRVARDLGISVVTPEAVAAVLKAYREKHPADQMGPKRVHDALSVSADAMAEPYYFNGDSSGDLMVTQHGVVLLTDGRVA